MLVFLVGLALLPAALSGCKSASRDLGSGSGGSAGEGGEPGCGGGGGTAGTSGDAGSGAGGSSGTGGDGATGGEAGGGAGGSGGTGGMACDCTATQSCVNGSCEEHTCEPGLFFCSDGAVHECADDGLGSTETESCDSNQYCDEASASCEDGACEPNQPACDGNVSRLCNEAGSGFESNGAVDCTNTNETCVDGSCQGVCGPDQTQCSGNGVEACNASGQWGAAAACAAATPHCSSGVCGEPPSCQGLAVSCGASANESCCTSPVVTGGTYNRINDASYPATVSDFRLDKVEVTVGRFRKFKTAWDGGWRPSSGAGKHTHLNSGNGLVNSGGSPTYEPGWDTAWEGSVDPSDAARNPGNAYATWTPSAGSNETRPINFVNWYESYAFCIWDGGFLPSEAEWNYAAAGGSEQRAYPWGSTAPGADASLGVHGCYYAGNGSCTGVANIAPAGSVVAGNGRYGQSDLAGNVWEWNQDWYDSSLVADCNNCSHLPIGSSNRVLRGGSFGLSASLLLTSVRDLITPASRGGAIGVRCARTP